jgi:hypothetical protein
MTHQLQKLLGVLLLAILLACTAYVVFQAYLTPEFLIGFANLFVC